MKQAVIRNGGSERTSCHIKRRPAVNIHHATRYAQRLGLPLNRAVTINFDLTECNPARASHAFRKLLTQRFAPWLRRSRDVRKHVPPTYVWTLECPRGHTGVHWLVHVPRRMYGAFNQRLTEWLTSLLGAPPEPGAIKIQRIRNMIGLRHYVLKGTEPIWAAHLGVRHVDQGMTVGKRSGFSRNLGPAARKRGGYKPRRIPPRSYLRTGKE